MTKVPALSILLPTYRNFPENKKDPIRIKNLVREAAERLSQEFSSRDIEPLLQRLEGLVNEINYPHTLDGLALYVSHDFAKIFYLPFPVPERVVIDQTFATRDLVYGLHRAQRYWVLLLSQASTRLLAGTGETLEEVFDSNFPMQMTGPGATTALPPEVDSSYIDDRHRQFFRQVDQSLQNYIEDDSLPLIVGGVIRQISFFQEVSQHTSLIAGTVTGNFDKAPVSELSPHVWPIMQEVRENQRTNALRSLENAVSQQKAVFTVEEVWRLASEGRGSLLLVEKDYHVPAVVTENGGLTIVSESGGVEVMDDAVDEIIEVMLAKGGDVILMDNGSLAQHQHIALTLRY